LPKLANSFHRATDPLIVRVHVFTVAHEWPASSKGGAGFSCPAITLELEDAIAARAKGNQVEAGKDFGKGCQKSDKAIEPVDTKRELATIAGVSHDTVAKASTARPAIGIALGNGAFVPWNTGNQKVTNFGAPFVHFGAFRRTLKNRGQGINCHQTLYFTRAFREIPGTGVEPAHLSIPDPKSGASTNSAIPAGGGRHHSVFHRPSQAGNSQSPARPTGGNTTRVGWPLRIR